jgi:peptidyl-tRNA hydrolase, PTH1 family
MYIIAGLGNPGKQYEGTRHNMGFEVIDKLAEKYNINVRMIKSKALTGSGIINGEKVLLVKPQTFMNLSGTSLCELVNFYKIDPTKELIVISDDIELDPGRLRIRKGGSAGGHNGLKDIIARVGTQDFPRIRVGVGKKPSGWDLADFVMSHPDKKDRSYIDEAQNAAAEAVVLTMEKGAEGAMNRYNGFMPKELAEKARLEKEAKAAARAKAREERNRQLES